MHLNEFSFDVEQLDVDHLAVVPGQEEAIGVDEAGGSFDLNLGTAWSSSGPQPGAVDLGLFAIKNDPGT